MRSLLILTAQLALATKQVDHTAAFAHADIDKPPNYSQMTPDEQSRVGAFVEMPGGFAKPGCVCKLMCDASTTSYYRTTCWHDPIENAI